MFEKFITWFTGKILVDSNEWDRKVAKIRFDARVSGYKAGVNSGKKQAAKGCPFTFEEFEKWHEFAGYSNKDERDIIARFVQDEDWPIFRQNMIRQGLKFHYDAKDLGDAKLMAIYHVIGNKINHLARFYDNAPNKEEDEEIEQNSGFEPE